MALIPDQPPWPQGQYAVHDPAELAGLHYRDVAQSIEAAQRRGRLLGELLGPAVVHELLVDLDTARDHLRSVYQHFAEAVNRERTVKAMEPK